MPRSFLHLVLVIGLWTPRCRAFVQPLTGTTTRRRLANTPPTTTTTTTTSTTSRHAVKVEGYDDAMRIIDASAVAGQPSDDLYDAVRFVDRNAVKISPDLEHKQALWDEAHGSWKLQLATGGGKYTTFKPVPIFAFAMIDEQNFGNGIGWNADNIILSLLGPHYFNAKIRQMVITIDDMYIAGGNAVTAWLPEFVRNGLGLGKTPDDFVATAAAGNKKKQRPPAFTMICASEHALVARGGSGGIAIWKRLDKDIRPAAYGK